MLFHQITFLFFALIFLSTQTVLADGARGLASDSYVSPTIQQQIEHRESEVTSFDAIFGNWGGLREDWAKKGYEFDIRYKGDMAENFHGGLLRDRAYVENLDVRFTIDAEKAYDLPGTTFFIYGLGNHGRHAYMPSDLVGDLQGTSNIEATADDFKLYEFWIQKLFYESRLSILFGLHDLNSEFYVTESSTTLLNPSFGIGQEFAQTGSNGPSIFPYTAPTFRLRTEPSETFYLATGLYVAQAGDPEKPTGVHVNFSSSEGYLMIIETGLTGAKNELPFKVSLGGWTYTKPFPTIDGTKEQTSSGAYTLIDFNISENFSSFVRYGVANTHVSNVGSNLSLGLLWKGPFTSRIDDEFSMGATRVTIGTEYHDQLEANGTPTNEAETTFEISYRAKLNDGLYLQPDFQYVKDPGADETIEDAYIGFLRLEFSL